MEAINEKLKLKLKEEEEEKKRAEFEYRKIQKQNNVIYKNNYQNNFFLLKLGLHYEY